MKLRKHQTLREQIVSSLRETIIKGELTPGQKLTEPELAENLGISRTPIREAFRQLESEGFLTVMPRRGAVVSKITRKEINDFYELKSLLEGYAARIAAGKINARGIQKLRKINDQLSEIAEKDDIEAFFLKNDEFHNVFISYCGNEKLLELLEDMVRRFMRFRLGALSVPGRLMKSIQQHNGIIDALAKKDGHLAETLVLEHALLSGEELAGQITQDEVQ
jgi:DNA-binding GntR family transcriptional regulator